MFTESGYTEKGCLLCFPVPLDKLLYGIINLNSFMTISFQNLSFPNLTFGPM